MEFGIGGCWTLEVNGNMSAAGEIRPGQRAGPEAGAIARNLQRMAPAVSRAIAASGFRGAIMHACMRGTAPSISPLRR